MLKVSDIYKYINLIAPFELAEKWDNVGLLIGNTNSKVSKVLLALDLNKAVLSQAIEERTDLIICHHPIIFKPLSRIELSSNLSELIKNDINVICAHTNLDKAKYGVNFCLAQKLGLNNLHGLKTEIAEPRFMIRTHVSKEDVNKFETAMKKVGIDEICSYQNCISESSDETIKEIELKMFCKAEKLELAIAALKSLHPDKRPKFNLVKDHSQYNSVSLGVVGEFKFDLDKFEFLEKISQGLNVDSVRYFFPNDKKIKRVACCGGAGASLLSDAIASKADAFITGDVRHDTWYLAENNNIGLIDAGHFFTENLVIDELNKRICTEFKDLDCKVSYGNTILSAVWIKHYVQGKEQS